jgi:hypothetical protein
MKLVIYCADIGSVPNGRLDWARTAADEGEIERHRGGTEIVDLLDWLADDLAAGRGVALGLSARCSCRCPSSRSSSERRDRVRGIAPGPRVRVPARWRPASSRFRGSLSELRRRCPEATSYLDWAEFAAALLHAPCLTIKAASPASVELADTGNEAAATDPTVTPRAHRDRREIERKRQLLEAPHVASLAGFEPRSVRTLRDRAIARYERRVGRQLS